MMMMEGDFNGGSFLGQSMDYGQQAGPAAAAVVSNNMVVAVRVRPLSPKEEAAGCQACAKVINQKLVVISKAGNPAHYLRSQQGTVNEYGFDVAFDEGCSQAEVYEHTAKRHVPSVLDGCNVTVFAYGATGAGKTHTMMGSERTGEVGEQGHTSLSGIIPQSLVDIFDCVRDRRQQANSSKTKEDWKIYASFLEVYNEQIFDLVAGGRAPLAVREDSQKGVVQVAGLSEVEVCSTDEVLDLLRQGNRNRKTESTAANVVSSRSHAVLQLSLRYSTVDGDGNDVVRESKLSLIDLAGSERASATQNRGMRLHEGANINKSLLALANCINALAENNGKMRRNVKYRDSKLTHLLKTSLEGDCKLIMIANINPSHHVFEDSHNTLKYANRAKNIKIKPGTALLLTQEAPAHVREARLRADNDKLRYELEYLRQCLLGNNKRGPAPVPAHSEGDGSMLMEDGASVSGVGNSSFLSAESMEVDEQTATPGDDSLSFQHLHHHHHHQNHDGRRRSTRRASQLIPLSSPPPMVATGQSAAMGGGGRGGRDVEDMMLEMTRTREFMQGLIESLNRQKAQTEGELQTQRQETQSWQRQAQEKDQEISRLREQIVELRTRLEQVAPWSILPSSSSSAAAMGGGGSNSADAMEGLQFSPINPPPSMMGGASGFSAGVNQLTSPSAAAKRATRRRMSQIPRFTQQPPSSSSARRTTLMPSANSKKMLDMREGHGGALAAAAPTPTQQQVVQGQDPLLSSGRKRTRAAWGGSTTTMATGGGSSGMMMVGEEAPMEKENKAPRTAAYQRRESVLNRRTSIKPPGSIGDGVAQRTRSRQSVLPPPPVSPRFCF